MLDNPWSIILLIISGLLIVGAVCSKRLRRMHNKDVNILKGNLEKLSKKEQNIQKTTEDTVIFVLEILLWLLFILGVIFVGTKY